MYACIDALLLVLAVVMNYHGYSKDQINALAKFSRKCCGKNVYSLQYRSIVLGAHKCDKDADVAGISKTDSVTDGGRKHWIRTVWDGIGVGKMCVCVCWWLFGWWLRQRIKFMLLGN